MNKKFLIREEPPEASRPPVGWEVPSLFLFFYFSLLLLVFLFWFFILVFDGYGFFMVFGF
jgi:hypothetical protein